MKIRDNIKKVLRESSNVSIEFVDKYFLRVKGDYHGLPYNFKLVNDDLILNFKNPKDLSYNPKVLEGCKLDLIEDFHQVLGGNIRDNRFVKEYLNSIKISFDDVISTQNTIYLNDKDFQNFQNISKTINKFQIEGLECDVKVIFRGLSSYGGELTISADVYFLTINYKGKKINREDFIKIFGDIIETHDGVDYCLDFLEPLTDEITKNYPLLFDTSWMYYVDDISFKYKDGEKIVWW